MSNVRIVLEIGINHQGSLEIANQLIDMGVRAGVSLVKFQIKTPELSLPKNLWERPKETPWGTIDTYINYRRAMEFSVEQFKLLDRHCAIAGIRWFASVWDIPALEKLMEFFVPYIKIPSAALTNDPLLKAINKNKYKVILSTGMSTLVEVDHAVSLLSDVDVTLLHCHSAYPSPDKEQSLSTIDTLRKRYKLPVGFSSHATSPFVPLAAVSRYGVCMVEVHGTLSRSMFGSDHAASLEEKGISLLVREVQRLDILHGTGEKEVWPGEIAAKARLRV